MSISGTAICVLHDILSGKKKNKTEIQFHENAVAVCPGGQGEERIKSSSIYLTRRYILQVLLYCDLLSSAFFFSFPLAFIAEGVCEGWGGEMDES